jgi:hypothetical protein
MKAGAQSTSMFYSILSVATSKVEYQAGLLFSLMILMLVMTAE